MAGEITIYKRYGSDYSVQETGKNIFYFMTVDSAILDKADYPLIIPQAGTNYSYEAILRAKVSIAPAVSISNIKFWYGTGLPSGYSLTVNSNIISTYVQPVQSESSQGTRVDFTTKDSSSNSIALSGTLVSVNDASSYAVFQLEILSSAVKSASNSVTWYVQYDEV